MKLKNNKAITLVALVITIVVLLILAGVVIGTLGSNGIIEKSKFSKTETENAQLNEVTTLENYAEDVDENTKAKYTVTLDTNGGTLPAEQASCFKVREDKEIGTISSPSKTDWEFVGWYTEKDGGIKIESTARLNSDVTIYAQWKLSETKNFSGYYADVDNDGTVDGIIFIDLLRSANSNNETVSGRWVNDNGLFEYKTIENSKKYSLSEDTYKSGNFEEHLVISAKNDEVGNDRFYVLSLTDETKLNWNTDYSTNKYCILDAYTEATYSTQKEIGTGKRNTEKIISESDILNNENNFWSKIKTKVDNGWFVPSRAEWCALGDYMVTMLGCNGWGDYNGYGLRNNFWTSSQKSYDSLYVAWFYGGYMSWCSPQNNGWFWVRLATTF